VGDVSIQLDNNTFNPDSEGGFISSEQNSLMIEVKDAMFKNEGGKELKENFFYFRECANVLF